MNIVIRTDSSIDIGLGHVMRSMALANELKRYGHSIKFAVRKQNGDSIDYLKCKGFHVYELPHSTECLVPKGSSDYAAFLQVPFELDADQFISVVKSTDVVIVDHYSLGEEWEKEVKSRLNCKIVAIDDLVRKHDADLIIDQTLMRTSTEYKLTNDTNDILTGCDYALLNHEFIAKREQALEVTSLSKKIKILISMGGFDKDNTTLRILKVLQSQGYDKNQVTVILGRKSPNYKNVKDFCSLNSDWIEHLDFSENMAEIILTHSIAIGTPGTTSWERACLGIPSIIIPVADNQRTIARNLVSAKASILVEKENINTKLASSLKELLKNWYEFRQANLRLCDGLGVRRVLIKINNLNCKSNNKLSFRRACLDDINQVFDWQCHKDTRRYALITDPPKWEEHERWMKKKLNSAEDFFYMITLSKNDRSVGVVRLDRIKIAEYIVSIFVSPDHYNQGIAKEALSFLDDVHRDVTIHAKVLEDNTASQRLFTVANYSRVSSDTFIRLPII